MTAPETDARPCCRCRPGRHDRGAADGARRRAGDRPRGRRVAGRRVARVDVPPAEPGDARRPRRARAADGAGHRLHRLPVPRPPYRPDRRPRPGVLSEDTRFPFRVQIEQSKLTPIILEVLEGMDNVTVHFDQRVVAAETDGDVGDGDHRGRRHLHRRLGARCRRRQLAGAPDRRLHLRGDDLPRAVPGRLDHRGPGVDPARASRRSTTSSTRPSGWCCCARRSTGGSCSRPTRSTPDEVESDPARVQERMRGVADLGRDWDVLHTTLYRVHQRVADTFRKGRLLLMGDAAHINNPLGGMGMNSGIHDAYVETKALLALIQGDGTVEQLDEALRGAPPGRAVVRQDDHPRQLGEAAPGRPRGDQGLPRRAARAGRRPRADAQAPAQHLDDQLAAQRQGRRHGRRPGPVTGPAAADRAGEPRPHRRARRHRRRGRPGRRRRRRSPRPARRRREWAALDVDARGHRRPRRRRPDRRRGRRASPS